MNIKKHIWRDDLRGKATTNQALLPMNYKLQHGHWQLGYELRHEKTLLYALFCNLRYELHHQTSCSMHIYVSSLISTFVVPCLYNKSSFYNLILSL